MKETGVIRKVDPLGRIVLPIELRRYFDIEVDDILEVSSDGAKNIILHKYAPGCLFCGSTDELNEFKGKKICKKCLKAMGDHAPGRNVAVFPRAARVDGGGGEMRRAGTGVRAGIGGKA